MNFYHSKNFILQLNVSCISDTHLNIKNIDSTLIVKARKLLNFAPRNPFLF